VKVILRAIFLLVVGTTSLRAAEPPDIAYSHKSRAETVRPDDVLGGKGEYARLTTLAEESDARIGEEERKIWHTGAPIPYSPIGERPDITVQCIRQTIQLHLLADMADKMVRVFGEEHEGYRFDLLADAGKFDALGAVFADYERRMSGIYYKFRRSGKRTLDPDDEAFLRRTGMNMERFLAAEAPPERISADFIWEHLLSDAIYDNRSSAFHSKWRLLRLRAVLDRYIADHADEYIEMTRAKKDIFEFVAFDSISKEDFAWAGAVTAAAFYLSPRPNTTVLQAAGKRLEKPSSIQWGWWVREHLPDKFPGLPDEIKLHQLHLVPAVDDESERTGLYTAVYFFSRLPGELEERDLGMLPEWPLLYVNRMATDMLLTDLWDRVAPDFEMNPEFAVSIDDIKRAMSSISQLSGYYRKSDIADFMENPPAWAAGTGDVQQP